MPLVGSAGAVMIRGTRPRVTGALLHEIPAGHDPDRIALRRADDPGAVLTYGQLDRRARGLAHALHAGGIGAGDVVTLLLERSFDLVVAQLAVLYAGGAWCPLDPRHPQARLAFQAADARSPLLLTSADLAVLAAGIVPDGAAVRVLDRTPWPDAEEPPNVLVRPADPAYVIYTSGSTGVPKGVLVAHRSAAAFCAAVGAQFRMVPTDTVAQVANPAFDVSVFDTFATLHAGATLVVTGRDTIADADAFTAVLREQRVTVCYTPPAVLGLLDPDRLRHSALRLVFSAGETVAPDLVARWIRPGLEVHNAYGPTETTVLCTDHHCADPLAPGPVPIGAALPGQRAYVLDRRLRPTPIGVPGELHVAGTGVAHGYLDRAGLTATRFLPDPHGGEPGERMYATGDVVRWRADGVLEYLGRRDGQVKLRGQRIELGEIEHVLAVQDGVRACAVVLRDRDGGEPFLAAYVVGDADPAQLRGALADRLPTYMIPTAWIALDALPRTPNGKLDHAALPAPAPLDPGHGAPRTETERWLADVWRELLGVDRVGVGDGFFALGGNSLHATQLAARVREAFGVDLHPRTMFTDPVLEQLAARLDEADPAPLEDRIVPVPRTGALPCTHQQEGLWFEQRLDPASATYHIPFALRLRGTLDLPALRRALGTVVARHEALRTRFVEYSGTPRQVVDEPAPVELPVVELPNAEVAAWVQERAVAPLALAQGPVHRVAAARTGPDEHVLVLVVHHIVADGYSIGVLAGELSACYAAETGGPDADLPVLRIQPADHAAWQRTRLDGAELERQLGFWRSALADLPTIDFPTDRARPARPTGAGAAVVRDLPSALAAAVRGYARTHHVSFLAVLQAGLLTVLQRHTGQDDLPIGSVFSGRTRTEIAPLVGFFANTLVLRTDLDGDPTFTELVRRCHDTVVDATAHQDVPFGLVVDTLVPERVVGRNPLFQISLTLQPAGAVQGDLALGDVTAEPVELGATGARFDLAVNVSDAPGGGLAVSAEYSTELFDGDRVERLLDHFATVLAGGLADPRCPVADLELMSAAELAQVLQRPGGDGP